MIDIAEAQGQKVDAACLAETLGVPVATTIGRKGRGKNELRDAVTDTAARSRTDQPDPDRMIVDYEELEGPIAALKEQLGQAVSLSGIAPLRWFAIKLLEGDAEAFRIIDDHHSDPAAIRRSVESLAASFEEQTGLTPADHIIIRRDSLADKVVRACLTKPKQVGASLSDKVDRVLLNRALAPFALILSIYLIYEISIVQGYKLTEYTWPLLAWIRDAVASLLPAPG